MHVHIDEHREKKLSCGDSPARGGSPSKPPCERGSCPLRSIPFIYVRMWVKKPAKCYKKVGNFYAAFWLILHVNIDKRESKKI